MTVKEFIKQLKQLGFNDETTINFGFCDANGEWFDFEVEEFEDEDRAVGVDSIGISFKQNQNFRNSILEESNIELEEDLREIIRKYCIYNG